MSDPAWVRVGKAYYWVGLEWETIATSDNRGQRLKELRRLCGPKGLRCLRVRPDLDVVSIGYAPRPHGKMRAAPALAAAVADARREPWMGIFDLGDGNFWYVAVREGQAVIPGGDLIGSREAVDIARGEHMGLGEWSFFEGGVAELEGLLADARSAGGKPGLVTTFVPQVPVWIYAGIAMAVAGGFWWHHRQVVILQHEAAVQAAVRASRLLNARDAMQARLAAEAAARPWAAIARPRAFVRACLAWLGRAPINARGWRITSAACALPNRVSVQWIRDGGSLGDAPAGIVSPDGNTIRWSGMASWRLGVDSARNPPLASLQSARRAVFRVAQPNEIPIQWTLAGNTSGLPGAKAQKTPNLHPTVSLSAGPVLPSVLGALNTVPTLRILSISINEVSIAPMARAQVRLWLQAPPAARVAQTK